MSQNQVILTVFTPTYNRAHLLARVYESLREPLISGAGSIEWLIVDDGSTDETPGVIESFVRELGDVVRVVRTQNGGKHRAINAAHDARGKWVMILDSDDWLETGAMSDIVATLGVVGSDARVGVVRAFRRFVDRPMPSSFGVKRQPAHHGDWVDKNRTFDTAEVVLRSALRRYPFPDFAGERFMAESWLWNSLDSDYMTWFVERPWSVCEYQPEGLSAKSTALRVSCPMGAMATYSSSYARAKSLRRRIRAAANWWRFNFHRKLPLDPRCGRVPHLYALAGWVLWCRDLLHRTHLASASVAK